MEEIFFRFLASVTAVLVTLTGFFAPADTTTKKTDFKQCKNVIFLIGDGMGFNSIKLAEQELGRKLTSFDGFSLAGESKTASATSSIIATDSAAGGSALATGVRISLDTVGVYPDDVDAKESYPMNLTELAISQGKAAGIVTTAKTYDATPADFSAHIAYRGLTEEIHRQQSDSELTLLWGANDDNNNLDYTASRGFDILTNKDELDALDMSHRSFGQFKDGFYIDGAKGNTPTLSELTEKAIDILDNDDDGFFLMVEGAHIDKSSDDMDKKKMSLAMDSFDKAITVALDYAKKNGDTMVILTADHETGGITELFGRYFYTTTLHTSKNVPLLVYGCDNFITDGEVVENREISRRTACVMGETDFPREIIK